MIPTCLTLSITRYVSRIKWSNPGKGVPPSSTPRCSSYWKGSLRVTLDNGRLLYLCYILTLDRAVYQRCTCVNKRKKKRKHVVVMKKYRQVPAAVELVEAGRPEWEPACRLRAVALSDPRLSNPNEKCWVSSWR